MKTTIYLLLSSLLSVSTYAKVCTGFGPQTPRDITSKKGKNKVNFSFAPDSKNMNLCNIHFHINAEHKGPEFSKFAGKGENGGYKCNSDPKPSYLAKPEAHGCHNALPGDTVEVHWVYTSCDVKPGKTLGACLSDACPNPQLRVEAQVFQLINKKDALHFTEFDYGSEKKGYHQPKKLPEGGKKVQFLGSTTGPKYTEEKCSPMQVTWNVSPKCLPLDISSLHEWCEDNLFGEDHGHGVRELVKDPSLLSDI